MPSPSLWYHLSLHHPCLHHPSLYHYSLTHSLLLPSSISNLNPKPQTPSPLASFLPTRPSIHLDIAGTHTRAYTEQRSSIQPVLLLTVQNGRQRTNLQGTHTMLSYHHFTSTWSTRTFLPLGDTLLRGFQTGGAKTTDTKMEGLVVAALERVRAMDPDMAGSPMSKVKRQVYATILLALRCLHTWYKSEADMGVRPLIHSQARCLDSLFYRLSLLLPAPSGLLHEFQRLYRDISG